MARRAAQKPDAAQRGHAESGAITKLNVHINKLHKQHSRVSRGLTTPHVTDRFQVGKSMRWISAVDPKRYSTP